MDEALTIHHIDTVDADIAYEIGITRRVGAQQTLMARRGEIGKIFSGVKFARGGFGGLIHTLILA